MKSLLLLLIAATCAALRADDPAVGADGKPLDGMSSHGEAFNEGPRQAAVSIPGTGNVHFQINSNSPEAQRFFDQGLGQFHGFWYFEAERSFRQVVKCDPDCAMAYCALALANINNDKRAADFMKEAVKRQDKASPLEKAWITAYAAYFSDGKMPTPERRTALVKALEKIVFDFPDDVEVRAMLVLQLWENQQKGIPLGSRTAITALAESVLAKNPNHPGIHHFLIHLWNGEDDRRALKAAAVLGQSAPGIAHMWHMPGHTFTKLKRFADAAWQQEASARTDHAQMIAARLMPEQIHNYAHNNDWLVEDLSYIGRVRDAVDLAKNMIELPRLAPSPSPANKDTATHNDGYTMGRRRLLETMLAWGRWEDLLALDGGQYLDPFEDAAEDARRLLTLGIAAYESGNPAKGDEKLAAMEFTISKARQQRYTEADEAEAQAKKEKKTAEQIATAMVAALQRGSERMDKMEGCRAELRLLQSLQVGKIADAKELISQLKNVPPLRLSRTYQKLGDLPKAIELATRAAKEGEGQVLPLANLADLQWRADKKAEARATFEKMRPLCAQADLGEMPFIRLRKLIEDLKLPADWRPKLEWPNDSGKRPDLAELGPFRWHPSPAPGWQAADAIGQTHNLAEHKGHPLLLVFYLGSGCAHCIEQLNLLSPLAKNYEATGIHIVAMSADTPAELTKTFAQSTGAPGFPFPILSDPTLAAFKSYRAFDDFETTPLHGTFLIDAAGNVRWQDISFRPFRELSWLLGESKRLLALPPPPAPTAVSTR